MTVRSMPRRPLSVALAAALLVAACGTTTAPTPVVSPDSPAPSGSASQAPSPSPSVGGSQEPTSSADAARYAAIEREVVSIRELQPTAEVAPQILDAAGLLDIIETGFNKDNPPEYVAAYGRLLAHLGLMDPKDDLGQLFVELLASQVIGLYDEDTKELYVVSRQGGIGPTQQITFAHEYTHALQDQHFDLTKLGNDRLDEGDLSIARTSVAEGDATLLMFAWAQQNMTPEEFGQAQQEASDPESQAILERMPKLLQETLQFPYVSGLTFVLSQWSTGGWDAVDALYGKPPDSTEQILHPEKYASGEAPIDVAFPTDLAARLGTGWSEALQDTLGEFQIGIWLREVGGLQSPAATDGAAGWGGDRLVLLEGPDDAWAVVVDTAWDTKADATAFVQGSAGITKKLSTPTSSADVLQRDGTSATILVGSSRDVVGKVANVLGLAG